MQLPVQITFRDVPASEPLADSIREHAERLDCLFERITRCDVTVTRPGWRGASGTGYVVRIDMTVPGGEIVIGRGNGSTVHNDPYSAVHDAFDRARRRLEEYRRIRRDRVRSKRQPDAWACGLPVVPTRISVRYRAVRGWLSSRVLRPSGRA